MDVEDQGGILGDEARVSAITIRKIARDRQGSLFAQGHLWHQLVPALNDLANSDLGFEVTSTNGAVELVTLEIGICLGGFMEPARVGHGDGVSLLWEISAVAGLVEFLVQLGSHACE